jgi:hypothetical protein
VYGREQLRLQDTYSNTHSNTSSNTTWVQMAESSFGLGFLIANKASLMVSDSKQICIVYWNS